MRPDCAPAKRRKQVEFIRLRQCSNKFLRRPAIGYLIAINSHYACKMIAIAPQDGAQPTVSLGELHKGAQGSVVTVREDGEALGDETGATIVMRLIELGFVPGETFEIIGEHQPLHALLLGLLGWKRKGDPVAVRIGGSCFALRRREAAAVMVRVNTP
jgi:Fe2+ transport system protein FeoA